MENSAVTNFLSGQYNATHSSTNDEGHHDIFIKMRYVFLARDLVCLPLTLFGNILILVAIARFSGLCRATSSILVANLATSDLLMGSLVFPVDIGIRVSDDLARTFTDCSLYQTVVYIGVTSSVLSLFLLSIERFHAIVRPLHHFMVFTKRRVYIMIMVVWITVATFGALSVYGWDGQVDPDHLFCPMITMIEGVYFRVLSYLIAITMTLNTIFLIIIARVVFKKVSSGVTKHFTESIQVNTGTKRDIRHTILMLLISGLFIVFWGPFCVMCVIPERSETIKNVHILLAHVGMFNSCLNWFVYGWRSTRFRHAFKSVMNCQYNNNELIS